MKLSIRENMKAYLNSAQIDATAETMGIDSTLIKDGTYFVIESEGQIIACGGWGKRKTLYGSDFSPTHDDRFLCPKTDAARIRAMYTHPNFTRQGHAAEILRYAEMAAADCCFKSIELGSTLAGQSFYERRGYTLYGAHKRLSENGETKITILMRKTLVEQSE